MLWCKAAWPGWEGIQYSEHQMISHATAMSQVSTLQCRNYLPAARQHALPQATYAVLLSWAVTSLSRVVRLQTTTFIQVFFMS